MAKEEFEDNIRSHPSQLREAGNRFLPLIAETYAALTQKVNTIGQLEHLAFPDIGGDTSKVIEPFRELREFLHQRLYHTTVNAIAGSEWLVYCADNYEDNEASIIAELDAITEQVVDGERVTTVYLTDKDGEPRDGDEGQQVVTPLAPGSAGSAGTAGDDQQIV